MNTKQIKIIVDNSKPTVPELPAAKKSKQRPDGYYNIITPIAPWFTDEYVKHAFKSTEDE